jgi:hypothetical protein
MTNESDKLPDLPVWQLPGGHAGVSDVGCDKKSRHPTLM